MIKKYKFIQVRQNSTVFYLVSIDSKTLSKICKTSINNLNSEKAHDTYQRTLNYNRVKQISSFVQRDRGIMPPAIVLNSLTKIIFESGQIIIDDEIDQFFVIDGQHRIAGVNLADKEEFYFPVVILDNVDQSFQDELFVSINNEQKRVNPTVRFRLKANSYAMTPEKAVLKISLFMNEDSESPFYGLLRMDDKPYYKKTATLSLSAFAQAIISYIYDDNDYYRIKDILISNRCEHFINGLLSQFDEKYKTKFLWKLYSSDKYELIGKILYNYFNALKKVFAISWGNKEFITTKTTGYNAFMLLFKDVFFRCYNSGRNFSFSFMRDVLSDLNVLDIQMTQKQYGLGKVASITLYKEMHNILFGEDISSETYNSIYRMIDDSEE